MQTGEPCVRVLALEAAALDRALDPRADPLEATLERFGNRVVQVRLEARDTGNLSDPGAHRPRADDPHDGDLGQPGTSGARSPSQ